MDSDSSNKMSEDTPNKIYESKLLLGIIIGFLFYGVIGIIWHYTNGYVASVAFILIPVFFAFIISSSHK